ncbi:hypothetical protein F4212_07495 [Candidatus Poribacteria bacterium]|nr:hypothetical protein [Candidatus Poribacteria bacterium]
MLNRTRHILIFLLVLIFSGTLQGNETAQLYFPSTVGSFWVYTDQDGNEFVRHAIEGEEIDGVFYNAFSYNPELEDWVDFNRHTVPYLYNVNEEWISLLVGEEIENAVKARLTKEFETFSALVKNLFASLIPPEENITIDFFYDIEVDTDEYFNFLPADASIDDEWETTEITATVTMSFEFNGLPEELAAAAPPMPPVTVTFSILETGIVLDVETVETAAGTFEDCLKIEYRTETELTSDQPEDPGPDNPPGETVTTLWLAPNIGIVKYHQEAQKIFLNLMSDKELAEASVAPEEAAEITAITVKSFELSNYEIAPDPAQEDRVE